MKSLKSTLFSNALFSFTSGLVLAIFNSTIAKILGIDNSSITLIIGIALLLFGITVVITALGKPIKPILVKTIIFQDWVWVAGSSVIVLFNLFDLSSFGYWLISIVAVIVATFAVFQKKYLK